MMINPRTGDTIWYYSIPKDHEYVLDREEIHCFVSSVYTGTVITPWHYLSSQPETLESIISVKVDTQYIHENCQDWSYLEDTNGDKLLRIHVPIKKEWIIE